MGTMAALARLAPFHLAIPVRCITEARHFYGDVLKCTEGRSSHTWVDFNLHGHQLVAHRVEGYSAQRTENDVDGDAVPVPHFGVVLDDEAFHSMADNVRSAAVEFVIEPQMRFEGQRGEQWTMFFRDPSANSLEFKALTNPENLFAKYHVE